MNAEPPSGRAGSLALLPVRVDGDVKVDTARLERGIVRGLRTGGFEVAVAAREPEGAAACASGPCALQLGRALGAALVVRVAVTASRGRNVVEVVVLDAGVDGAELARERAECGALELCAPLPEMANEVAANAAREARQELTARSAATPAPKPAPVVEDGARAIAPPLEVPPEPTPALSVRASPEPRPWLPRWVPWTLVGGGAALVATGVALFALDGGKVECGTAPVGSSVCFDRRETTVQAWVTTVVGAGALGAGGYLIWRERTAASVTLGPTGLAVAGRF